MNKPSKYRNIKTTVSGIKFDSKAEAAHYGVLNMRVLAKEVDRFEMQVKYPILVNGVKVCTYIADFVTYKNEEVAEVIDVKGVRTSVFSLKAKLMLAVHGIKIVEITKRKKK